MAADSTWMRSLNSGSGTKLKMVCWHYGVGTSMIFRSWRGKILPEVEICTIELPGRGLRKNETPYTDCSALIEAVASAIASQLDTPFVLYGHSMGALMSFELSKILHSRHQKTPQRLILSGCVAPHRSQSAWWPTGYAPYIQKQPRFPRHLQSDQEIIQKHKERKMVSDDVFENPQLLENLVRISRIDYAIVDSYVYKKSERLSYPVTVIGAYEDNMVSEADIEAWSELAGPSFEKIMMRGDHFFIRTQEEEFLKKLNLILQPVLSSSNPRAQIVPGQHVKYSVDSDVPFETLRRPSSNVFSDLEFVPSSKGSLGPHEVELQVVTTGLNFKDVLNVLGMYPGEAGELGLECAGIVSAVGEGVRDFGIGDAVVGVQNGSFASYLRLPESLVASKPDWLTFEEAATIPVTFLTAMIGLIDLANIKKGERVLIHSAAGGVGYAAVQVALDLGAEVFATAGSDTKRKIVRELGAHHVMDSRTLDFAQEIHGLTGGKGVDVVLNSLIGEFLERSLELLQKGGRFLEIGKRGLLDLDRISKLQERGVQYLPYDINQMWLDEPDRVGRQLRDLMQKFSNRHYKPLPLKAFSRKEVAQAFKFMAQAKHIGKVIVVMRDELNSAKEVKAERTEIKQDNHALSALIEHCRNLSQAEAQTEIIELLRKSRTMVS